MAIWSAICLLLFAAFSFGYQANVRSYTLTTKASAYQNLRLDYGRDHTIKMAIHAELTGKPILDYRGASLLFDATAYIPRALWQDKPLPYAAYLTCYALDVRPPRLLLWGFTTSILDEAIANFSWAGLLLGPLILGLLCRLADSNTNSLMRILGMLVCLLLLSVHLPAFLPLFLLWVAGSAAQHFRGFLRTTPSHPH